MPAGDLRQKFEAFGLEAVSIDGHNMAQLVETLDRCLERRNGKPKCIVCDTIKGRGVSFMENVVSWHGTAPNEEEYIQAMKELEEGLA